MSFIIKEEVRSYRPFSCLVFYRNETLGKTFKVQYTTENCKESLVVYTLVNFKWEYLFNFYDMGYIMDESMYLKSDTEKWKRWEDMKRDSIEMIETFCKFES